MLLALCQAITGGSDAIGAVLCPCLCLHSVKVLNHGSAQTACLGEGHTATAASTEGSALGVGVGGAGVADCACHEVRCCCEYCSRSEGDGVSGGGADFGKVCGTFFDALGFQIGGDRFQNLQKLGTVSGTVQEGGGKVAGHGRMLDCGLERKGGGRGSEVRHHVLHLSSVDGGVVPCHPIACGFQVASDLPVHHAAHELLPGGLPWGTEFHTCLCGVVQKLIVSDPQGSVPGFVVCPTVHDLGSFGM